jgi:hypothetical protein
VRNNRFHFQAFRGDEAACIGWCSSTMVLTVRVGEVRHNVNWVTTPAWNLSDHPMSLQAWHGAEYAVLNGILLGTDRPCDASSAWGVSGPTMLWRTTTR